MDKDSLLFFFQPGHLFPPPTILHPGGQGFGGYFEGEHWSPGVKFLRVSIALIPSPWD